MPTKLKREGTRARAEERLKKEQERQAPVAKAMGEDEAGRAAVETNTKRLRALRLGNEALKPQAASKAAGSTSKAGRRTRCSPTSKPMGRRDFDEPERSFGLASVLYAKSIERGLNLFPSEIMREPPHGPRLARRRSLPPGARGGLGAGTTDLVQR
jgi:hypothetical protein